MGGIGHTLARWLATECPRGVLLTGRTRLPPSERMGRTPGARRAGPASACDHRRGKADRVPAGGAVLTACADAADAAAMERAVAAVRSRWGEIDGVIHAAGTGRNRYIAFLKSEEEVRKVFAPKLGGLRVLAEILGDTQLEFVVLMSSINAVMSAPGLSDYAAANAFLDAFVESTSRPRAWKRVVALDWGAWQQVGMAAQRVVAEAQRKEWEAYLASSIKPAAGVDAFARALASGHDRIVITPFDLSLAFAGAGADVGTNKRVANAPQANSVHVAPPSLDMLSEVEQVSIEPAQERSGLVERIVRAHPAVVEAAVVRRKTGAGTSRPVIYIAYHPGEELTASEVRAELKGRCRTNRFPRSSSPLTPFRTRLKEHSTWNCFQIRSKAR